MKRSFTGRLAAVTAVLCLVTMSLTSGTLAKYASSASGSANAVVAKWAIAFKSGDGNTTYDNSTTFELNLNDADQVAANLVKENKVAPGTDGSFAFQVDGTGTEVAYTYTIELDLSGVTAPLAFYNNADLADAHKITPAANKITLTGDVLTTKTDLKDTATIYWKWDSTGIGTGTEDERDTALGEAAATFTIPVTITATQKTTV